MPGGVPPGAHFLYSRGETHRMEISEVSIERVSAERTVGRRSAIKEATHSTSVLVEVAATNGVTGLGEVPDVENPEEIPPADELEATLEACLHGRDPRAINRLSREIPEALDLGPTGFHSFQQLTAGAIDAALYDLVGNSYGIPAYRLLGGARESVPLCWVVFTRYDDGVDDLREEVDKRVEQGFESFKLKVGERGPEIDEERIRAVREVAGDDVDVFLDAQGAWSLSEAIDRIERFASLGIDGVETPVGHPDSTVEAPGYYYDVPLLPDDIAQLRAQVDVPIMEHVLDPAFGIELVRNNAVDVFTVEVCSVGITATRRILGLAESADLDARVGSTLEFGPATQAGVSLAAASPAVTYPSDLIGPLVYEETVLDRPVEYEDGAVVPRDEPGFGISV